MVHRPSILRRPTVKRKSSPLCSPLAPGSAQRIVATTKATSLPAVILISVISKGIGSLDQEKTSPTSSCRLRFPWIETVAEHRISRCQKNSFGESLRYLDDARRRSRTQPHRELPRRLLSRSVSHPSEVPPEIANSCRCPLSRLSRPAVSAQERWLDNLPAEFQTETLSRSCRDCCNQHAASGPAPSLAERIRVTSNIGGVHSLEVPGFNQPYRRIEKTRRPHME